jgi:hypothetical protein
MQSKTEFFQYVANKTEILRQELRARVIPLELRDTAAVVAYNLRQAHNHALAVSRIDEAAPVVGAAGGEWIST